MLLCLPDDVLVNIAQKWIHVTTCGPAFRRAMMAVMSRRVDHPKLKSQWITRLDPERIESFFRVFHKRPLPITRVVQSSEHTRISTTIMELYSSACTLNYMYFMRYHERTYYENDQPPQDEKRWTIYQMELCGKTRLYNRHYFKDYYLQHPDSKDCEWQG